MWSQKRTSHICIFDWLRSGTICFGLGITENSLHELGQIPLPWCLLCTKEWAWLYSSKQGCCVTPIRTLGKGTETRNEKLDSSTSYKIRKQICASQLQPLNKPCSQHRAEVSGWSWYTKDDFGSSESCMNQSCETKWPSAAFKPHCGRESIFDKHFAKDTN